MSTFGTAHFVSVVTARRYYRECMAHTSAQAKAAVADKLARGEIHIGAPQLLNGQVLSIIDDGTRYAITELDWSPWRAGNDGASARIWFVFRESYVGRGSETANNSRGVIRRFKTWEAAKAVADALNWGGDHARD